VIETLRSCTREEFEKYIDFAYGLAMDLTKSGYPTYCDGIKTKAMFIDRLLKAFERDTEELLLFEYEGEVQGVIHFYRIPEDSYIQTNCFNIGEAAEQALSEFLAYAGERYKGYDLYMGFPAANTEAVRFLAAHGFECIENDYNNTAYPDRLGEMPVSSCLVRIGRENYDSFRKVHDQIEEEMYWNSDRISDDLDEWTILVREQDGEPQGAVYYMDLDDGWFEIFGIDMNQYNPEAFKDLLIGALMDVKHRNGTAMTFFCEKEYEKDAVECGFQCIGNYLCHRIHLG
jgi:N-acetylglutamate synthase-like GNAT family acetyltransferase